MDYMTTEYTLCHGPFCVVVRHDDGATWCWELYLVRADDYRMKVDGGSGTLVNARAAGVAALRSLGVTDVKPDCPGEICG